VLSLERGTDRAGRLGLDALFLLRDDRGSARGVGVGRPLSEEPAALPPAAEGS
jgi:thiamine biosynthesis lipoprotein